MFVKPRPKKSILPPPSKKRKFEPTIEEISFDDGAREEYLTGFHKRKQQRIKRAQEEAAKRARQEKIETRKQMREDRRREVEEHVETVNRLLRESGAVTSQLDEEEEAGEEEGDEWGGFPDKPDLDIVDHEEEYIDEDRYTTVTVESVSVSRDGLSKPGQLDEQAEEEARLKREEAERKEAEAKDKKPTWDKKKKKKFRYETKFERQLSERKRKAKSRPRKDGAE